MFKTPPGEGERRAALGLRNQYAVSAALVLRALRSRRLEWIRLADPEAGRVDDLLIGGPQRVDAYQVKWSGYASPFTWTHLTRPRSGSPSLIAQLADGWRRTREVQTGRRVVVHLITNDYPSVNDSPPVDPNAGAPRHFAAFLEEAWNAFKEKGEAGLPAKWQPAWNELCECSGLPESDFESFVADCELALGSMILRPPTSTPRDLVALNADLQHIAAHLFEAVADPRRIVELSRDQLLEQLGWQDRFRTRSVHEFPVEEALYSPVTETAEALTSRIEQLTGGYLAVLGTPGSGKSTLLTQVLRYRPERVIRYYAFVPGAHDLPRLRGEASSFLHDVVVELEEAGVSAGHGTTGFDREHLLERFHEQLGLLSEDWQSSGRKTLVLVDGLDHVPRELKPTESLLGDLPDPDQIPEGVLFILGSQTDQLDDLPTAVQTAIRQLDRRIEMAALARSAAYRVVDAAGLPVSMTDGQKDRLYELSGGNPLALRYLLNLLQNAADSAAVDSALACALPFEGNIDRQYSAYWGELHDDYELTNLLGVLCRIRRPVDLDWVRTWADKPLVDHFRDRTGHYFRRLSPKRWTFFHNSFRVFLQARTVETSPGQLDEQEDRRFHKRLAGLCQQTGSDHPMAWERLFHLAQAADHSGVIAVASQEWFRGQFMAMRPADSILGDIRLALRSVGESKDAIGFLRLMLALTESASREDVVDRLFLARALLRLGDVGIALEQVTEENGLRIGASAALEFSRGLVAQGLTKEAERVFDLAEPLDVLGGSKPLVPEDHCPESEEIKEWARSAVYFRSCDHVLAAVAKMRVEPARFGHVDQDEWLAQTRNSIKMAAIGELADNERWGEVDLLLSSFDRTSPEDLPAMFWSLFDISATFCRDGRLDVADRFLSRLLGDFSSDDVASPETKIALADLIYLVRKDTQLAGLWLENTEQPQVERDRLFSVEGLWPWHAMLRFHRLKTALGDERPVAVVVPDAEDPHYQGLVYFERALCRIAWLSGRAISGRTVDAATVRQEFVDVVRLFYRDVNQTRKWWTWYVAEQLREDLFKLLVRTVAKHGDSALGCLRGMFEAEWADENSRRYWPSEVRRSVVLAFHEAGTAKRWVVEQLDTVQTGMLDGRDPEGRAGEAKAQTEAWLAVGEPSRARSLLDELLRSSFGVAFRKDYQLTTWISWLGRANTAEPSAAAERVAWFAGAVVALDEYAEGDLANSAALELLDVTCCWSPRCSVRLFDWMRRKHVVDHEDGIRVLIRALSKAQEVDAQLVFAGFIDILQPISRSSTEEDCRTAVAKTYRSLGAPSAISMASEALLAIDVLALPSTRPGSRRGVALALKSCGVDYHNLGLLDSDVEKAISENGYVTPETPLKLATGDKLASEDVLAQATSLTSLQKLMVGEDDNSRFHWDPVVEKVVASLDAKEIGRLEQSQLRGVNAGRLHLAMARRYVELGLQSEGYQYACRALQQAEPYEWRHDGTALEAAKLMAEVEPVLGRRVVFSMVSAGLAEGRLYTRELLTNMDEVLPCLAGQPDVKAAWAEIEEHVRHLFADTDTPDDCRELMQGRCDGDSADMALVDLLLLHLDSPQPAVSIAALHALARAVKAGNTAAKAGVTACLAGTEARQEQALKLLDALSTRETSCLDSYGEALEPLLESQSYLIRVLSRRLLGRLGRSVLTPRPRGAALPAIYDLWFPRGHDVLGARGVRPGNSLPDSRDPISIIRPFDFPAEPVARLAGVPLNSLAARMVQIMEQLQPREKWSKAAEDELQEDLHHRGLEFSYRRPRTCLARRALHHVIAELFDAGKLDPSGLDELNLLIVSYDPVLVLRYGQRRPKEIGLFSEERATDDTNKWVTSAPSLDSPPHVQRLDGKQVLAEESKLKWLARLSPTESRYAEVIPETEMSALDTEGYFFARVDCGRVADYPELPPTQSGQGRLVIQNIEFGWGDLGEPWLALNPRVAEALGWQPADQDYFAWTDRDGRLMVQSIWWQDGILERGGGFRDEVVGEGWLVVATQKAMEQLEAEYGMLKRRLRIERRMYTEDREEKSRSLEGCFAFDLPHWRHHSN